MSYFVSYCFSTRENNINATRDKIFSYEKFNTNEFNGTLGGSSLSFCMLEKWMAEFKDVKNSSYGWKGNDDAFLGRKSCSFGLTPFVRRYANQLILVFQ